MQRKNQKWGAFVSTPTPRLVGQVEGGPAGGRSRFIELLWDPWEIKVKGGSLRGCGALFINQSAWDRPTRLLPELGGGMLGSHQGLLRVCQVGAQWDPHSSWAPPGLI